MIKSYDDIKAYYTGKKIFDETITKFYGENVPEEIKLYEKNDREKFKAECRAFYKRKRESAHDPYSVPIRNNKYWRTVSTDGGETCTDFIILPDHGQTNEDIKDFVHCSVYCPKYSYDFATGREITMCWYFKRTPYGIIIIHERGIDW